MSIETYEVFFSVFTNAYAAIVTLYVVDMRREYIGCARRESIPAARVVKR